MLLGVTEVKVAIKIIRENKKLECSNEKSEKW